MDLYYFNRVSHDAPQAEACGYGQHHALGHHPLAAGFSLRMERHPSFPNYFLNLHDPRTSLF